MSRHAGLCGLLHVVRRVGLNVRPILTEHIRLELLLVFAYELVEKVYFGV